MTRMAAVFSLCFALACAGHSPGVLVDAGTGVTPIRSVQGESHHSQMLDEVVTVEGVVTGILDRTRLNGFWLQESRPDSEPASSGIFVRTRGASGLSTGDVVRVTGEVREFAREGTLSLTQIDASEVIPADRAAAIPEPVRIGAGGLRIPEVIDDDQFQSYDPGEEAIDFWESLEGMRVEIGTATVVGPSSRFGDFVIVPESEAGDTLRTDAGGVLLQPDDENAERITVDASLLPDKTVVRVGDRLVGPVYGIVHYDFGNYRLMATGTLQIQEGAVRDRPSVSAGEGSLTIASYNVLNLSAADPSSRFIGVASSIVADLGSPDIVGLQEIQDDTGGDDDGIVSAEKTLGRLVDAIVDTGGPRYQWRQIDPLNNADGGAPGSNIRVAYLINPDRVEIVHRGHSGAVGDVEIEETGGTVRLSLSPGRIGTTTGCFLGEGSSDESEGTRKSLALEVRFRGETFFLINNHLKSKRGDDGVFGPVQPPVRHTEAQRTCQAELIASVAEEILQRDPGANVVVLGDMNEHEFRSPMEALENAGLVSMIRRVPAGERYTYNYLGNSQVLDHVFVSPALASQSRLVIPHVNSIVSASEAASDHDPVLLIIDPTVERDWPQ